MSCTNTTSDLFKSISEVSTRNVSIATHVLTAMGCVASFHEVNLQAHGNFASQMARANAAISPALQSWEHAAVKAPKIFKVKPHAASRRHHNLYKAAAQLNEPMCSSGAMRLQFGPCRWSRMLLMIRIKLCSHHALVSCLNPSAQRHSHVSGLKSKMFPLNAKKEATCQMSLSWNMHSGI